MLRCMICGESFEGYVLYNSGSTVSTINSKFLEPAFMCKHCRTVNKIINNYAMNYPDCKDMFNDMMKAYIKEIREDTMEDKEV